MPREPFRHPEDAVEQLDAGRGAPRGAVRPAAGGAVAVGRVGVGRHGAAGGERRLLVDGHRRRDSGAHAGPRLHAATPKGTATSRSCCIDRIGSVRPMRSVACGFRDHALSDLIGFSYASWSADGAAGDFVHRLVEAGRRYAAKTGGGEATVFVILDGENAWESYDNQGRPFLRALYRQLGSHPELRTVTMAEACAGAKEPLPSIFPGSWINSRLLHLDWARRRPSGVEPAGRRAAGAERAATGAVRRVARPGARGDAHRRRQRLVLVVRRRPFLRPRSGVRRAVPPARPQRLPGARDARCPRSCSSPTSRPSRRRCRSTAPTGFITPDDRRRGRPATSSGWAPARSRSSPHAGAAMHQVSGREPGLSGVEFGFDLRTPVRPHRRHPADARAAGGLRRGAQVPAAGRADAGGQRRRGRRSGGGESARLGTRRRRRRTAPGIRAAVGRVLEVQIPFRCLGVVTHQPVAFFVALNRGGTEVEHHPRHRPIELEVPAEDFASKNWTA